MQLRREHPLHVLAEAPVQHGPASRRLPPIAHVAVQRMDKGLAWRDAAVRQLV